jgi:hypothetical protein
MQLYILISYLDEYNLSQYLQIVTLIGVVLNTSSVYELPFSEKCIAASYTECLFN